MKVLALGLVAVILAGCVAEQPASEASSEADFIALHERWDLEVTEAQIAGIARGGPSQNCLMIQAESMAEAWGGHVRVAWESVSPVTENLHVTFERPDGSWDPRIEGRSPLEFGFENLSFEERGQASVYVGAVREGQIVVAQAVVLELVLQYRGQLRTYSFGCTIAG